MNWLKTTIISGLLFAWFNVGACREITRSLVSSSNWTAENAITIGMFGLDYLILKSAKRLAPIALVGATLSRLATLTELR